MISPADRTIRGSGSLGPGRHRRHSVSSSILSLLVSVSDVNPLPRQPTSGPASARPCVPRIRTELDLTKPLVANTPRSPFALCTWRWTLSSPCLLWHVLKQHHLTVCLAPFTCGAVRRAEATVSLWQNLQCTELQKRQAGFPTVLPRTVCSAPFKLYLACTRPLPQHITRGWLAEHYRVAREEEAPDRRPATESLCSIQMESSAMSPIGVPCCNSTRGQRRASPDPQPKAVSFESKPSQMVFRWAGRIGTADG